MVTAPVDRRALREDALDLERRYSDAFKERGGDLQIRPTIATTFGTRSIELVASVQWNDARFYDHAHIEVSRRRSFSRQWVSLRSPDHALREVEEQLQRWLSSAPPDPEGAQPGS